MTFARLVAKSTKRPDDPAPPERLAGHTADVVKAADLFVTVRGEASLRAAGLPTAWLGRLRKILIASALMHDLGKASYPFQLARRSAVPPPELLRHEAVSLWLCWPGQPLADWLRPLVDTDDDYQMAVVVAAAHHRKLGSHPCRDIEDGVGLEMKVLTGHRDFRDTLRIATSRNLLPLPPALSDITISDSPFVRDRATKQFQRWQREFDEKMIPDVDSRRLLSVAKALLICADVAASASPKARVNGSWLENQLRNEDKGKQLGRIIRNRLKGKRLRPFQLAVGASAAPITLATAGCGSGKTVAAMLWFARQHGDRRLWLTYPTTGTATEGFRDYMNGSGLKSQLVHGRAVVDYDIFELRDEGDRGERAIERHNALRQWGLDAVTCTVDTVLGLIQNNRRGIYAWPNLATGAVVFDEIHAYDAKLFGALLRFLEALPGIPALLMTASLPEARLRALDALSQRVHGRPLVQVQGPAELERLPRYRWAHTCVTEAAALAEVRAAKDAKQKVLWVSNAVDRCMEMAEKAEHIGRTLSYHSRFRYIDRVDRHRDVINAFDRSKDPNFVVACTTQVAEMSLDLSADLLIVDLASIPALIQRLGRLARFGDLLNPPTIGRFIVLMPNFPHPYQPEELEEAKVWLERLRGRDLSQRDLVDAWEQSTQASAEACDSTWLDAGFYTQTTSLRESFSGIPVLREEDAEAVEKKQRRMIEVELPMDSPPKDWKPLRTIDNVPVAAIGTIKYDEKKGGKWAKIAK